MLKQNRYQERVISKIFHKITNSHCLSLSQQQMQATDIPEEEIMTTHLPYIEGATEKIRRTHRSRKIRSTFYTENTLRKLLWKQSIE